MKIRIGIIGIFLVFSAFTVVGQQAAGKSFGTKVTSKRALSMSQLISKLGTLDSMPAKVTGTVTSVCQKKGCWMTLKSEIAGQPDMRVTFKDYAFFMPKDLSGRRVVVEGYAYVDVTPVDLLRHYAEDAGKSKAEIEAIKSPKRELAFEAAGVLILD
jgi:hypothetical protein